MQQTATMPPETPAAPSVSASGPAHTSATTPTAAVQAIPELDLAGEQASPGLGTSLASTALALCFVLVLAWLALRIIKRFQFGKTSGGDHDAPRVVRSVALGQRERLVTVHYRGREYLLGVAAGAVSVIDTLLVGPVESR